MDKAALIKWFKFGEVKVVHFRHLRKKKRGTGREARGKSQRTLGWPWKFTVIIIQASLHFSSSKLKILPYPHLFSKQPCNGGEVKR